MNLYETADGVYNRRQGFVDNPDSGQRPCQRLKRIKVIIRKPISLVYTEYL
jgi:hypothetical protein